MGNRKMEYYKPLEAKPDIVREKTTKQTEQRKALNAFAKSKDNFAVLLSGIISLYKTPISCARGLGRIIKTEELAVKVYSHDGNVYLEKIVEEASD